MPPVKEKAVYDDVQLELHQSKGKTLYNLFDKVITLKQIMRQQGHDVQQETFRDILTKIKDGGFSQDEWHILNNRNYDKLSKEEQEIFDKDSIMLCSRNKNLIPFNIQRTQAVGEPIAVIKAVNEPKSAKSVKASSAGGILNSTILCKGSRIMLKSNLWSEKGLTNGAQGTVVDIIYQPGNAPPNLPDLVLVKVDQYTGPGFLDMDHVVPIVPKRMHWFSRGKDYFRTGLPLIPAYAISIHNSQGMTLERVILGIV